MVKRINIWKKLQSGVILILLLSLMLFGSSCRKVGQRSLSDQTTQTMVQSTMTVNTTLATSQQGGVEANSTTVPVTTPAATTSLSQAQLIKDLKNTIDGLPSVMDGLEDPNEDELPLP